MFTLPSRWDVHLWLGSAVPDDAKRAAAKKCAALIEMLPVAGGKSAVTHAEAQDHESPLFMSYFKKGVEYLPGEHGDGAGFARPDGEGSEQLLSVSCAHHPRAAQVSCTCRSLHSGGVFLLDTGPVIYHWSGAATTKQHRAAALELAATIRDEAGRRIPEPKIVLVEEGTEHFQFWKAIPGGKTAIRPADYPAPVDVPPCRKQDLQLYRVTSESPLAWELVSGQPLQRASLAASDWFILSTGVALYTWVGKLAGLGTDAVVLAATEFVEAQGLSSWTPIEMM